jgi:tetratricopeptide (TPR) repeat protein/TolB-like protein
MRILTAFIAAVLLAGCAVTDHAYVKDGKAYGVTSGLFRDRWWNYYERGLSFAEGGFYEEARQDFQSAIGQRDKDQWRSRTYGMHFVDYFPHRELGTVYFLTGRYEEAVAELEASLQSADSAKAKYFLNKARKALLEQRGGDSSAPVIRIVSPADGTVTNGFSMTVRGEAEDDTFVSSIAINGVAQLVELSAKRLSFEQELPLKDGKNDILVRAVDLTGKESERLLHVVSDREGPVIVVEEAERLDGNRIRLSGSLADSSDIRSFSINGAEVPLTRKPPEGDEAPGQWEFAHEVEATDAVTVKALDAAGNATVGALAADPGFRSSNGSRLYASLARQVAILDTLRGIVDDSPPVLSLADMEDFQTVYDDTFYIEGNVTDNSRVQSLTLNGEQVLRRKGKQVFFSHLVKLEEGRNVFVVEAEDIFGNTARAVAVVERKIPRYRKIGSRMSIVILPLENRGEKSFLADAVYDGLIAAFVTQGRFRIIEREKISAVLEELRLGQTELVDRDSAVKVGKIVTADAIMIGTVYVTKDSLEVLTRLVNTETSAVMETKDVFDEDTSLPGIKSLAERLAFKFRQSFPVMEGIVIKKEGDAVLIDIGGKMKVKKDMGLIIFREGEQLRHPVTGRTLGIEPVELGEARVEAVYEYYSRAQVDSPVGINVMDSVITK